MTSMAGFKASHFLWRVEDSVAVIQLNRPERKNPLTFDSYAELRDTFRKLPYADDIHAVVFCQTAAISVPAATCTRSSDHWSPWT